MTRVEWGSIADWVSGLGSFAAAIVALYVALSAQRVKLRGYAGNRVIIGPGQPRIDVFSISVTNVSQRPTVITNVSMAFGFWRWRKLGVIALARDEFSHGIPMPLGDGETANWNIPLGPDNDWMRELSDQFPLSRWNIFTWRVGVHTSNGGTTNLRPDKETRAALFKIRATKPSG